MTPWIDFMLKHFGEHETYLKTGTSNPFIDALFKHTTYGKAHDTVPWCAACACTALEETGYSSPHNAAAVSFVHYGTPCKLQLNCIVVLQHPSGGHHVTFCNYIAPDGHTFIGLGGNQHDSICFSTYNSSEIIACRMPVQHE